MESRRRIERTPGDRACFERGFSMEVLDTRASSATGVLIVDFDRRYACPGV